MRQNFSYQLNAISGRFRNDKKSSRISWPNLGKIISRGNHPMISSVPRGQLTPSPGLLKSNTSCSRKATFNYGHPGGRPLGTPRPSSKQSGESLPAKMSGDTGVSAFPEGENIFSWIGTIEGGKGTPYEGLSYKLSLRFPLDYPFKPPQVKFETPCFHPNVDQYGNICLDILQDMWSSAYDCRTILLSIQSLLGAPNIESPLNNYAATLWSNQEDYNKMVHKQYIEGGELES